MTIKAKPPYMTTVLSRKESNPYSLTNGIVRARTDHQRDKHETGQRCKCEATHTLLRRNETTPMEERDLADIKRWRPR